MDGPGKSMGGEHINEELLELYAMSRLDGSKTAEVEEHLLLCEDCQDKLEEIDRFVQAFRQASREASEKGSTEAERPETDKLGAWLRPMWAAVAAVAAVTVVVLSVPNRPVYRPEQSVDLRAMRGEGPGAAEAAAGRPLVLRLDAAGLEGADRVQVELVEASGRVVWTGEPEKQTGMVVKAPAVTAGTYWVRLLGTDGETLREFGLRVK